VWPRTRDGIDRRLRPGLPSRGVRSVRRLEARLGEVGDEGEVGVEAAGTHEGEARSVDEADAARRRFAEGREGNAVEGWINSDDGDDREQLVQQPLNGGSAERPDMSAGVSTGT
jgi:hypothetical protein